MQENIVTTRGGTAFFDGASSSSAPEERKYEVFLNFRGVDTRKKFTDHLYQNLRAAGIRTFRDNEELPMGKEIGEGLFDAIWESTISIPIFSKEYTSSKWCLQELTEMVKCKKNMGQIIFPIFYDVAPSEVKHQTESFEAAFRVVNADIVLEWKQALFAVAEMKGLEAKKVFNGYEGKLVTSIVKEVCKMLNKNIVDLPDILVGMDRHVKKMEEMLDVKGTEVRIVGIHGMGGIGKTTIAKYMYNQLCNHFQQHCSFLENIREKVKKHNGYDDLKNQLISDILKPKPDGTIFNKNLFKSMTVLIVLDEVEERCQLKEFVGSVDWFGSGSRIIVTTRNRDVLRELTEDHIYEVDAMNLNDSRKLFCKHAFESISPSQGYEEISNSIVDTAAGLPLSLVVTGSLLHLKDNKKEWEAKSEKWRVTQPGKVQEKLKISYEALDSSEKEIFLDIACHFIGQDKRHATLMWEDYGFYPESGIPKLVDLSLITIEDDNIFRMHDHLRDLGKDIVSQGNPGDGGQCSRLWTNEHAANVSTHRLGRGVQTLFTSNCDFRKDFFLKSSKLRYLHLEGSNLKGNFQGLLSELRWFRWKVPKDSLELTNFCPSKLIILDLSGSDIKDNWEERIQIKSAVNLRVLNLSDCPLITKTPNFSGLSKLERLILKNCRRLTKISSSVKHLKCLTYFNATDCRSLEDLPSEFGSMEALEEVYLDNSFQERNDMEVIFEDVGSEVTSLFGIFQPDKIPDQFWDLKSLVELGLSGIRLRGELSEDIGKLKNLRSLILHSSKIKSLPDAIGRLQNLEVLDLSHSEVETLPSAIGDLYNLRKLNLSHAAVKTLPVDIVLLSKLEELDCSKSLLEGEPSAAIRCLPSLRVLNLGLTKISVLLSLDISASSSLLTLDLGFCDFRFMTALKLPQSLKTLCVPLNGASFDSAMSLPELTTLRFTGGASTCVENSTYMSRLPKLVELRFAEMRLRYPPALKFCDNISQLNVLKISQCEDLKYISDLSHLEMLRELSVEACRNLIEIGDFDRLNFLEYIFIRECKSLGRLSPNLTTLESLKTVYISVCDNLARIDGLEDLTTLEKVTLHACPFAQNLPNLSNSKNVVVKLEID